MGAHSPIKNWFKGEDKTLDWTLDDGTLGEVPTDDPASWTYHFVMRTRKDAPGDPILQGTPTFQAPDQVLLESPRADTEALVAGEYYYTMARIDVGDFRILAEGPVELKESAERPDPGP